MKISEIDDAPQWLKNAVVRDEDVSYRDGVVIWHSGTWVGGTWLSGNWHDGTWLMGEWQSGEWQGGYWYGGRWKNGDWIQGTWRGGVWCDGVWRGGDWAGGWWLGGLWLGGSWQDPRIKHRVLYMAHLAGVTFIRDDRGELWGSCARSTGASGSGLWDNLHVETEGYFFVPNAEGEEVCAPGKHGCAGSVNYHGCGAGSELWALNFRAEHLLACDGKKIKVSEGHVRRVGRNPWELDHP